MEVVVREAKSVTEMEIRFVLMSVSTSALLRGL